ncbi:MAG: hypothetical protein M5U14_08220 [Acidimicrobiia bacterium]|nr:hypothetical protein [Acidimicrobiia bacterium]
MPTLRGLVRVILLLAFEAGALAVLWRLGAVDGFALPRHDPARWLAHADPEAAVGALARAAGLAVTGWLLVTTVLYALARAGRLPRLAAAVARTTLPVVRARVDRALAVSLLAATPLAGVTPAAVTPATATDAAPPPVRDGRADVTRDPGPGATTAPGPTAPAVTTHVIVPGEHLWSIAADHLARTTGLPPSRLGNDEIARTWIRVVEANRSRLASGDPDLVFPGEVVVLPEG